MWPSPRRLVLAAALAGLAACLAAGPAKAADSFTPDVDVTLAPGAGHDVAKTLSLGALPNQADLLFAIDTTGSMDAAIADARNEATRMVEALSARIPDARFAVADFKDYHVEGFDPGDDGTYPYKLDQAMTADGAAVRAAIAGLSADGGGDSSASCPTRPTARSTSASRRPRSTT